jgi:hypothetical protein
VVWDRKTGSVCGWNLSQKSEEDNEAGELDEARGSCGRGIPNGRGCAVAIVSRRGSARPANVACNGLSPILRGWPTAVGTVRCDRRNAGVAQLLIQRIAVIGTVADQILRFGFDHVEVEA